MSRHEERRTTWATVAESLSSLDDGELQDLLQRATAHGSGLGGVSSVLDLAGTPVFVKVVPLTELEMQPVNTRSTANLFGLPAFCQYGVGSPGFSAWRELEAHERATRWVLEGEATGFPLLYHWRLLLTGTPDPVAEHADPDSTVAYWHGAEGLADRLAAIGSATTGLVLFLEHLPHQLDDWLQQRLAAGSSEARAAIEMVDTTLFDPLITLNRRGVLHFDSHLRNLLTDGEQVLVTDFGLATALDFDLDGQERRFFELHEAHDIAYTATQFVNRLVTEVARIRDPAARNAYIVEHASHHSPLGLPPAVEAIVRRYAPVAEIINAFYWRLFTEARDISFPTELLRKAAKRASLPRLLG